MPFYLPLARRRLRIRGRAVTSFVPLFPGYLFLLGDRDERVAALATRRVVRALDVADQEGLWGDLRQVYRLIASGAPVAPEDRLVPGAAVEIHSGPLAGLRGVIVRAASGHRFVVQVDFIQRGASVLIDEATLTPVDHDPQGA
jgi:transcriptional antiterminator RfaH